MKYLHRLALVLLTVMVLLVGGLMLFHAPLASAILVNDGGSTSTDNDCYALNNQPYKKDNKKNYDKLNCSKTDGGICTVNKKKIIKCDKPKDTSDVAQVPTQTDPALDFDNASCVDASHCNLITKYVNPFIGFLSALVGLAVVIGIIWGAIEYSSSGGDPQKVAHAKEKIRNALIALVAFIFLFAFLQWLIPGGII